jgi:penicillin-binding protein 1C
MIHAINAKEPNREMIAFKPQHLHMRKVDVCTTTGDLLLEDCPAHEEGWFIPGVSPIHNHDVYRKILVDLRTGERACRFQSGITAYQTFEVWPTELQHTLENAGIHKAPLPAWQKNCAGSAEMESADDGRKPTITSPQSGIEYHAHINNAADIVPFIANADGESQTLHWFLNNQYLGASKPNEPFSWHSDPGQYRVRVVDDQGHSNTVNMQVVSVP